jgi:hypothetical protein
MNRLAEGHRPARLNAGFRGFRVAVMTWPPKTEPQVKLECWIGGGQGDKKEALYAQKDYCEVGGKGTDISRMEPEKTFGLLYQF